jgi:hypothetical protein
MLLSNNFHPWSAHLRRHCDDASLTFDEEGRLSLLVDRHKVDCRVAADSLVLSARICNPPHAHAERQAWLCRVLTLTNRHARERREFPVLGAQRTLQLHAWLHADGDYAAFCAQFDAFMTALDVWRETVSPMDGVVRSPIHAGDKPFRRPAGTGINNSNSTGYL